MPRRSSEAYSNLDDALDQDSAIWSDGGEAVIVDDAQDDSGEAGGDAGLPGIEPVTEYIPISNRETINAVDEGDFSGEEVTVDADYADEPELFGKIVRTIGRGVKAVVTNPVVRTAVKTFLAAKGMHMESDRAEGGASATVLEVVIGADDRVRITATTATPWSGICHLSITARNGQRFLGTGWLIAPRCIITAGHCVHIRSAGGWASHVDVTAGRNGATAPFGTIRSARLSALPRWVSHQDRNFDCGCIILPRPFRSPSGATPFNFRYAAKSDAAIRARALNIAGYPGDLPRTPPPATGTTMWFHARGAKAVSPTVITYDIDTAGGQSGSPVWHLESNVRTAVGIHTNGSPLGNSATRITPAIKAQLDAWRALGSP